MKRLSLNHNTNAAVDSAVSTLSNDQLVVFPSDTIYGLAANALSQKAVNALLTFKERPSGKPISIAVRDMKMLQEYVSVSESNKNILSTLLPGPFTAVLPSKHTAISTLEAEDGSLGVRIPKHFFVQALSAACPFPYTATSANIAGKGPHYSVDALLHTLSDKKKDMIGLIIDAGGTLPHNPPSTVLNLQQDTIQTLRGGSCTLKLYATHNSHSAQETHGIAQDLINKYRHTIQKQPFVILLQGDLGVGKTVFAQGVGSAIGVTQNVVSPTYVLYYEYKTNDFDVDLFHHFDLYRAQSKEDLDVLGINTILKPKNIVVMEWGEKIGSVQDMFNNSKATVLLITITQQQKDDDRLLQVYELSWN